MLRSFQLRKLLEDLAFLEKTGVFVEALGNTIKGSVTAVVADNLAAHGIGGFVESFGPNVLCACRFCTASADGIQNDILHAFECVRRSANDHDQHVVQLHEKGLQSVYGVKSECILHMYLKSFHAATSLPPDISHDLLEGIVPSDISLCLSYFISKKYFDLKWLNNVIASYPYNFTDAVNRPQRIPEKCVLLVVMQLKTGCYSECFHSLLVVRFSLKTVFGTGLWTSRTLLSSALHHI